jgi:hypothetical protein
VTSAEQQERNRTMAINRARHQYATRDPVEYNRKRRARYARKLDLYRALSKRYRDKYPDRAKESLEKYRRTPYGMFQTGVRNAKARGLTWTISPEQFAALREKSCYYCGGSLPPASGGLDRIDNARGYEPDNVLPCCTDCNRHRLHTWTVEEMKAAVEAVMAIRSSKCPRTS